LNNRVPNANAGADQTKSVSDTVTLDGSGSSDADGDSLTFSWSFVSKPGGSSATLSNTTAIKPYFKVDATGSYVVQLIVNDGAASSKPDTVTISTAQDSDNDGVPDDQDAFPSNPAETIDTDGDGIGNNADTDDDNSATTPTQMMTTTKCRMRGRINTGLTPWSMMPPRIQTETASATWMNFMPAAIR
jgi:hypothetical protein